MRRLEAVLIALVLASIWTPVRADGELIGHLPVYKMENHTPPRGFVPDEATAIAIAHAVLTPIYGAQALEQVKSLTARKGGEWWTVVGAIRCTPACPVRFIEVDIGKDGKVLRVAKTF